ncbi:MAG: T9SS type A sorting domain-containing protein [Proteobacteria bacterium]|nr:T9SS type A sorting domain-containing protein [Pseudomonadota bacterium]
MVADGLVYPLPELSSSNSVSGHSSRPPTKPAPMFRVSQASRKSQRYFTYALKDSAALPQGFMLGKNIPNPFNETTTIVAELPAQVKEAKIVIYSLNGAELQSYLLNQEEEHL